MICCGCLLWGVMTVAFSQCDSVMQGYIFWGGFRGSRGELTETHERSGDIAAAHWLKHGVSCPLPVSSQSAMHLSSLCDFQLVMENSFESRHQWYWAVDGDPQRAEHGG